MHKSELLSFLFLAFFVDRFVREQKYLGKKIESAFGDLLFAHYGCPWAFVLLPLHRVLFSYICASAPWVLEWVCSDAAINVREFCLSSVINSRHLIFPRFVQWRWPCTVYHRRTCCFHGTKTGSVLPVSRGIICWDWSPFSKPGLLADDKKRTRRKRAQKQSTKFRSL